MMWRNKLYDFLNLTSAISGKRFYNVLKILSSYYRSKQSGNVSIKGFPVSISIEPTTSCNLRCPQCPSGLRSFTRPTGMLEPLLFHKIIDELAETLIYLTFYFQGEPYLNPLFLDMVKYASGKHIYTSTSTNGHYLDEENCIRTIESGLDRLIVSIDGITQESYQMYRVGGKLEKVKEGIGRLVRLKKELQSRTPYIVLQFIVFRHNESEIEDMRALAKFLEVEIQIKTAQIYDFENGSSLIPENAQHSRYKPVAGKYKIGNDLLSECWRMWHSCVITWDGKVVPCCFDKDASHQLGDLHQMSFADLWVSEPYREFRSMLFRSRKEIDICSNCSEGTKVYV